MNYSPQDIQQGNTLKKQAEETPSNFGILDGATERPSGAGYGQRMAGPVGARAIQLMNDPNELARTQNWMAQFATNQGMPFWQARMNMANPQPQQQEQQ